MAPRRIEDYPELLTTAEAAEISRRAVGTLRKWACLGNGPIEPVRLNGSRGLLNWKKADLMRLIGLDNAEPAAVLDRNFEAM